MISGGAYLGPLSTLVIEKAIEDGLFSENFKARFSKLGGINTTVMSNYLEMPFNHEYELVACCEGNKSDAVSLWMIIDALIARSAKLTAANLAAPFSRAGGPALILVLQSASMLMVLHSTRLST